MTRDVSIAPITPIAPRPAIVVADDSPILLRLLMITLEGIGAGDGEGMYEVVGARDGDEALACIRQASPSLVLIDAIMPGRNGYEVCEEVRADRSLARQPYVIMLTAGGQAADRERAERAGIDEFMTKPFKPSELQARVIDVFGEGGPAVDTAVVQALRDWFGPDRTDQFESLFASYNIEAEAMISAIEADARRDDRHSMAKTVHQLRGSSATMGARSLARLCADFDIDARRSETLLAAISGLAAEHRRFSTEFQLLLGSNSAPARD